MNAVRPEFLSLKYRGVRTPWEIAKDPEKFGWQCRKYIKWKQVHEQKSDAKALKDFADKLLDEKILDVTHLGEINVIFEKVQRWRKDRDGFSVEPDFREGFESMSRTLRVANENPSIVRGVLEKSGAWAP